MFNGIPKSHFRNPENHFHDCSKTCKHIQLFVYTVVLCAIKVQVYFHTSIVYIEYSRTLLMATLNCFRMMSTLMKSLECAKNVSINKRRMICLYGVAHNCFTIATKKCKHRRLVLVNT